MKRSSRAWVLLPVVIVLIAVIGLLVSNFQKEAGIADPSRGGVAAVAAAAAAFDRAGGSGVVGYQKFNEALLVAAVARRNAPLLNPADTRLDNLLVRLMDCLFALRETWQAEIDHTWDVDTHGRATYWNVLHPALRVSADDALTTTELRRLCRVRAEEILREAVKLVN